MSTPASSPSVAMITGPTAGIGLAFAEQLAEAGHSLVLVARDRERLAELADRLRTDHGVQVEVLPADLTDRAGLASVEQRLADPARPVDLLVNNAGFGLKHGFLENSVDQEQAQLDVLVVAPLRLMHAALGSMVARGTGGIINVSSVAGFLPRGTYSAAKAYITQLSRWAHLEYADRGVRVMALCPGFVRTEFHQRMGVGPDSAPKPLWLQADRLVREALVDFEEGKAISVPSKRYKAIVATTRTVPFGVLARFQRLGRK